VPGQAGISPIAINLEGEIVGYYVDPSSSIHAFLRTPNGKITTWNGPGACTGSNLNGCYGSGASNLNAFGIVVGGYEDANFVHHNFVRDLDGGLKVFDVPGAGTGAYQGTGCPGCLLGFNQFGAIAGIWSDSNSVNHGFIRNPFGKITTFDAPGAGSGTEQGTGCFSDCPVSINDWGAVTGEYIDANNNYHGYLRSPEGKIVSFDPSGSVFTLPFSINDGGVITGYYADANFVYHGFLRFPD
jgi:predicted membrane protein